MTSCLAHYASYTRSFGGVQDFFRVTDYSAAAWSRAPLLSSSQRALAKRVSDSANTVHNAFSVPQTLFKATYLTACVYEGVDKGVSKDLRKKTAFTALSLTNSLTQALLFFKQMEFIKLAGAAVVDAIYNITNILMDTKDLYDLKSGDINSINLLKIIRNISSIASAALALGALVFVSLQTEAIAIVTLTLSVIWITTKIAAELLQNMKNDPHYSILKESL